VSGQAAEAVRVRLQALADLFDDDDLAAGVRLITPAGRERLASLFRPPPDPPGPYWEDD
jgi:hypothetical protein